MKEILARDRVYSVVSNNCSCDFQRSIIILLIMISACGTQNKNDGEIENSNLVFVGEEITEETNEDNKVYK